MSSSILGGNKYKNNDNDDSDDDSDENGNDDGNDSNYNCTVMLLMR
jgi:hypothetical protein